MPQALAGAILPWVVNGLSALGFGSAFIVASAVAISTGLAYAALATGAYLVSSVFAPKAQRPDVPKPEDGKYNLKASVPYLTYVLGKVKKAGDYAFLEETGGTAYHITVWAAHHIKGFTTHYLHDEAVTLNGSGDVTAPAHFNSKVNIQTRLGNAASTAYAAFVSAFSSIWTNDHRGDGLATVAMQVQSVAAEDLQKVFPSGMPQHSAIGEGHDGLIDPRTGVAGYSTNFAVFRYWHLTHPVGGKLTADDLYTADWSNAADVCDEDVTNRDGGTENRYHGGFWFRSNTDPVDVGRTLDQAGEMVIYERPDGKIGVHAGEFVTPDIRLTADSIVRCHYDANRRKATNVLAVRGRYTDPAKGYNTADAAIYGIPYPSDDERTKTVENPAVQKHNHIARLQKLAYVRANAPRVTVVAHYDAAEDVPYRRFVKVHYPPKLTEVVVEIIGRPKLSLRNLTVEFQGIVVSSALYDFDAATEEGKPGANVDAVTRQDVPLPSNFTVTIEQESVGGGSMAAYGKATFTFQNAIFQYEVEWTPTAGGAVSSTLGNAGETEVRTNYLADGVEYKFRARTWSVGTPSDWTSYQTLTATADPTPPGATMFNSPVDVSTAGLAVISFTSANSANYHATRIYTNTTNSFATATLKATEYGAPNASDSSTITLAAGTYYAWLVAINGSGIEAAETATGSFTVT